MLRNIAYFFSANLISKLCGFAVAFLLARSLGPASFGEWVTLTLIASYSPILCLGTVEALLKKVPFLIGRGDRDQVTHTERAVHGSILMSALAAFVIGSGALLIGVPRQLGVPNLAFGLVIATIGTSYFTGFYYNRLTAYQQFRSVGIVDVVRSTASLLLVGGFAVKWRLPGALLGLFLQEVSTLATAAFLSRRSSGAVGFEYSLSKIRPLVQVGLPITILWWSLTLSASVDRLMLGQFIDSTAVGFYSLGLSIWSLFGLIPTVVGRVLYPKVNRDVGRDLDTHALRRTVVTPAFTLGLLLVNLQVIAFSLLPYVYTSLLPKYLPGLVAGQVLTIGCYFVCLYRNAANYLIAINKEGLFFRSILVCLLFNIVVDLAFLSAGLGLAGIALGTSLSGMLLNSILWWNALGKLKFARNDQILSLVKMYLPVFVFACWIALWNIFLPNASSSTLTLIFFTASALLVVNLVLYLLPVYRAEMIRCYSLVQRQAPRLSRIAGRWSSRADAFAPETTN
jgi:O-antigen/teichoic acid export membrane protein